MYMIYQQYMSAIEEAYSGQRDVASHAESAKASREWLESLDIEADLRDALVEPMRVLEEAFRDLIGTSE